MANPHTQEGTASAAMCRHHWVIETPNGAVSSGRCKRCGTARAFRNSTDEAFWDNENFSLGGSRSRARRGNFDS